MWMSWSRDALCAIIDAMEDVRRCEAHIRAGDEERLQMRRPRGLRAHGARREELAVALTFADRLNMLFAAFLQPPDELGERSEYDTAQVARAMERIHGRAVCSAAHLRQLRKGSRSKPSVDVASAIARTFEHLSRSEPMPGRASALVAYLVLDPLDGTDEDVATIRSIHTQLEDAIAIRESRPKVQGIMSRLGDLEDDDSLQAVAELVEQLEQKEKQRRGLLRRRK
ncbi:MAG: hypothetical protein AB7N73_12455 [Gemmatimonadales bacterium]|jgi:hypothetical protein